MVTLTVANQEGGYAGHLCRQRITTEYPTFRATDQTNREMITSADLDSCEKTILRELEVLGVAWDGSTRGRLVGPGSVVTQVFFQAALDPDNEWCWRYKSWLYSQQEYNKSIT